MTDLNPAPLTPDAAPMPSNPISLADAIALRVSPHWAEAVAVVEELCAVLQSGAADDVGVPDLADITITAQGSVLVRKGARGIDDPDELGRILNALLEPGETPMPVRLFAAHAIGSGKYPTVSAYAEALAYYARPGRRELIRALYERCLTAPLVETPDPSLADREDEEPPPVKRRSRRWMVPVAIALLCGVGASAAVWAWGGDERMTSSIAAVREAVKTAADAVRQQLGVPTTDTPPSEAAAAQPQRRQTRPGDAPIGAISRELRVDGSMLPPAIGPAADRPVVEGDFASPPAAPAAAPAVSSMVVDRTVYTIASPDVQPPVLVSPKLPPVSLVDSASSRTNVMEFLIDESGGVENVRFVSDPVRLPDMWLLSAAKVWKFHPALKDGKPVRYRLTMNWVVSPR